MCDKNKLPLQIDVAVCNGVSIDKIKRFGAPVGATYLIIPSKPPITTCRATKASNLCGNGVSEVVLMCCYK